MISVGSTSQRLLKSHSQEWLFCLLVMVGLVGCSKQSNDVHLNGPTMGTTWSLTYTPGAPRASATDVRSLVEAELEAVNASMSTYREDAEISRFNRATAGSWHVASERFLTVLQAALEVGRASGGAFDVTVGPLVDLWGFGPATVALEPPNEEALKLAASRVGQALIEFDEHGSAVLQPGGLSLDFSSLAKGFAVDRIAQALEDVGVENYLLEVGGEMRLAGQSARGGDWRIAIEEPNAAGRSVAAVLELSDQSVATSGDYRNYFEHNGHRYSHAIDPRTGYPIKHDLVSVTVVHPSAMLADAWATALIVLGDKAMAVAQEQSLAVYFIRRKGGGIEHSFTRPIAAYLSDLPADQPSAVANGEVQ